MDFELDEHHRKIRDTAREIAETVIAPNAAKHDRDYSMPAEALAACRDRGLLKLCIPKELGGQGASIVTGEDPFAHLLVIEEFARVDMSAAHCFQVHAHTSQLLSAAGTVEQKKRWLVPVAEKGGILSWTGSEFGRTMRGHLNLTSEAKAVAGGGYILNGVKNYGTNITDAAWNVVAVNIADLPSPENFLLVVVPKGAKGLEVDASWWRPTGMRAAVSPKFTLADLQIPANDVLQGPGFYPKCGYGSRWHLGFAANHLGAAQGLFDFTIGYLPKRGTTNNPHTQRSVGEMRMKIAGARDLVYHAAWLWSKMRLKEAEEFSLLAKLFAIEVAEWMVGETIRVVGSTALLETFPVHRVIRDIHVHSTHANLYSTAQLVGRSCMGIEFDSAQQQ